MRFFTTIAIIIAIAIVALFIIKDNDALLLMAIATIIFSFFRAVLNISKEN